MNFESIEKFLDEAKNIYDKIPRNEKTFMEISGYPHYENVCSNILAFYLNPNEEHKLNDIVLMALLNVLEQKNPEKVKNINVDNLTIFREYTTLNGNRIDIVIQNEDIVIGIENKIMASVYNDLEDYSNTLDNINSNSIKILLSLHDESNIAIQNGFVNITYHEFFESLDKMLAEYSDTAQNKWYIYLLDFIKNLEGYKVEKEVETKINNWIKSNRENIDKLFEILNIAESNIKQKLDEYQELLENKLHDNKVKYWSGNNLEGTKYIVFDLGCNLDAYLSIDGWKLGVFIWKKTRQIQIKTTLKENGYDIMEEENGHLWLEKFDYDCDIEEVVNKASSVFKVLNSIGN